MKNNSNEEEFNSNIEIDEDNKIFDEMKKKTYENPKGNDAIKTKNNNENNNRLSNDFYSEREELHSFENDFQPPRSEFNSLRNNIHGLGNGIHEIRNDVLDLRNDVHEFGNDVLDLRNDVHEFGNDVLALKNDVHKFGNDVHEFKDEFINNCHEIRNNINNLLNRFNELLYNTVISNENSNNNEGQNNNINYDELLEEKEIDEDSFEKYKEEKCSICLEDFNIGNKVCYLPCLHIYHSFCIKNWLKIRGKCPLCGDDLNKNNS